MKKKTIRKIVYLLLIAPAAVYAGLWVSVNYFTEIDTAEVDRYYDLLKKHAKPASGLTLSLGVEEDGDLQIGLDRLQDAMGGLGKYDIDLVYGDQESPPAFVENVNNEYMTITVSRKIKQRREQLNVLVHELSHISVWSLEPSLIMRCGDEQSSDKSIFKGCNLEKVVDASGMFRGQGIVTLNGLTDEVMFIPGMEYSTTQKMYGYLKPEEFGYLLARYCAEHGISPHAIEPFLGPTGRKYFAIGKNYLKRHPLSPEKTAGTAEGIFWCPKCGNKITVSLAGPRPPEIHCPRCLFHKKTEPWWEPAAEFLRERLHPLWEKGQKTLRAHFPVF